MCSHFLAPAQCPSGILGHGIHNLSLCAAVVVVYAVALVVTVHETSSNEFRNRPPDLRAPGNADTVPDHCLHKIVCHCFVVGKSVLTLQFAADLPSNTQTTRIPLRHRRQRVREPVTHWYSALPNLDLRACAPGLRAHLRDEV